MSYAFLPDEHDSVAARLIGLFSLPSQIFDIAVPGGSISVKMRLLNDKENQEVSDMSDRYGLASRLLVERREILSRSVQWIENIPIEMPESVKIAIRDQTGVAPSDIDQKLWVFAQCQPVLLQELMKCYDQMVEQQQREIVEIKKKFTEQSERPQQEIKSSE